MNGLRHHSASAGPPLVGFASSSGLFAILFLALVAGMGCAASEQVQEDMVIVEGVVTARGHEPFVRYVLETSEGNLYALRIREEQQAAFQTPATLRVTGRLYVDEWDGRPFAHIDADEWTPIE